MMVCTSGSTPALTIREAAASGFGALSDTRFGVAAAITTAGGPVLLEVLARFPFTCRSRDFLAATLLFLPVCDVLGMADSFVLSFALHLNSERLRRACALAIRRRSGRQDCLPEGRSGRRVVLRRRSSIA
jgi:hypothetical protein